MHRVVEFRRENLALISPQLNFKGQLSSLAWCVWEDLNDYEANPATHFPQRSNSSSSSIHYQPFIVVQQRNLFSSATNRSALPLDLHDASMVLKRELKIIAGFCRALE
jgi:hypothetical protein